MAGLLQQYLNNAFRWRNGRQGTGYDRIEEGRRYVLSLGWVRRGRARPAA